MRKETEWKNVQRFIKKCNTDELTALSYMVNREISYRGSDNRNKVRKRKKQTHSDR